MGRKRFLAAAVVGVALALPGAAFAQALPGDSVVTTQPSQPALFIDVQAQSGPSGENPSGTIVMHIGPGFAAPTVTATVTCLSVSGSTAIVGFSSLWVFDIPTQGFQFTTAGLLRIVDGGPPGSGQDSFELVLGGPRQLALFPGPPPDPVPGPTDCSTFPGPFLNPTVETITDIDFVVTDAQPLPTSQEQCTTGGWRTFGVFKNQGDCVSFVATGGKKRPAKRAG
jgi:hypothetical protein